MEKGTLSLKTPLSQLNLTNTENVHWNLSPDELTEISLKQNLATLTSTDCLAVDTGEFTGRSPKDRFVVYDDITRDTVWWEGLNHKFDAEKFDGLYKKITEYLSNKEIYVRDAYACSHDDFRLNIRVVNELPWMNLFADNMFLRPNKEELENFVPDWSVISAPNFIADPEVDGTRQHNFAIINFTKKIIIIGGTAYTGEIKKGIYSILNYILPMELDVLTMH